MWRPARSTAVAVGCGIVATGLIILIGTLRIPATSAQVSPEPTATPVPSATATPLPEEEVIEMGPPSLPVSLAVVRGGSIIDHQIVGGEVILQGSAYEYTDQMVADSGGDVKPRTMEEIACWSGGGLPGSNPQNTPPRPTTGDPNGVVAPRFTSYCYGHSWIEYAVFNLMRTLEPGTNVILQLTTQNGNIYAYELLSSFHVDKGLLGNDPRVTEDVVNRLVTISCYRPDGYSEDAATVDNIVGIWRMSEVLGAPWIQELPPDEEIGVNKPVGAVHAE